MKTQIIFLLAIIAFAAMENFAQEQNIVLKTPTGEISGVLMKPELKEQVPVVLIIAGTGPTDKDGNQPNMQNNSLKFLAEALKQNGIASLRFDKRGIAGSKTSLKQESDLRFENYVEDVSGWINLLSEDKSFSEIIVAGHSEGSLIGMIASAKSDKVKKYVSIAGPALPADEIIKEQFGAQSQNVKDLIFPMLDSLKKGQTVADVPQSLYVLLRPSIQPYLISWFKYNPQDEIKKLQIPILVIQGDKDIQVAVKNAELLTKASNNATLKIIPNMNHVLKTIETTDQKEQLKNYSDPNLPINPEIVKEIVAFIKK